MHHELGAGGAVDGGVVDLGDDADAVVLEALDDPQLPQRADRSSGVLAIWPAISAELAAAAGAGRADAADVVVEVEVRVLDPDRVVEPERHLHEPAAERRHEVQRAPMNALIFSNE